MFLTATKTAVVESLLAAFGDQYPGPIKFKSVDIEYPVDSVKWPALLVNYRLSSPVTWTGINPDEFSEASEELDWDWTAIRRGRFEGTIDLTVLALTSQERDRLWDSLVELVLMGQTHLDTKLFHDSLNNHDLVALTILESEVQPGGDSIGPGIPWDREALAYEATLRLNTTGQFFANIYDRKLMSISAITVHPYLEHEEPFGDQDGLGTWR